MVTLCEFVNFSKNFFKFTMNFFTKVHKSSQSVTISRTNISTGQLIELGNIIFTLKPILNIMSLILS